MDAWGQDPAAKRQRVETTSLGLSNEDILTLVSQREMHRQARRFAESDAIREELRGHGVELYDKEKEWRCNDGRRGPLFTAGPTECILQDIEIQERVALREEARKNKDFAQADKIRDDLRQLGVELVDRESLWRTATGRCGTYTGAPVKPMMSLDANMIKNMVADRERFRAMQDFDAADDMRRQLREMGVEVFDNERVWKSSDGQQGRIITGGHKEDTCFMNEYDIVQRVAQREQARSQKNWAVADSIRDELRRNGIELLDNQKMWSAADGRQGLYANAGAMVSNGMPAVAVAAAPARPAPVPGNLDAFTARLAQKAALAIQAHAVPTQAPSVALTFSDASIVSLVAGREAARARHDWAGADAIRTDLRSHGVEVWDKDKIWRANDGRSGMIPGH
eukprot:TRINITY_DN6341_c0_g2_i1.p1 TRINITY_DN6341_c0_g2~~TRINITY_DN6341_c0_g2_i1.p1  ORF type:complete len:421 (-),score=97.27 TRINITY_DN6341_c0_g2_i1:160-1344(-)